MQIYRKKISLFTAVQWLGDNMDDVLDYVRQLHRNAQCIVLAQESLLVEIPTKRIRLAKTMWLVRDSQGRYSMHSNIDFLETFEINDEDKS